MSRRAAHATVEEIESDEDVFDDDTDIPLPSRPFPGGRQGPLLQAVDEDDDFGPGGAFRRGATSEINLGSGQASPSLLNQQHQVPTVSDLTPYKKYVFFFLNITDLVEANSILLDMLRIDGRVSTLYLSMRNVPSMLANDASLSLTQYGGL